MHLSFLSALFLFSRVMADTLPAPVTAPPTPATAPPTTAPPTPATAPPTTAPPTSPPNGKTPPPPPPTIQADCTNTFFSFSERDLAEMEQEFQNVKVNTTSLSTKKDAAICQNDKINAVCKTSSCNSKAPTCTNCFSFSFIGDGPNINKGALVSAKMDCDISYNFNQTNTATPYLCANSEVQVTCEACNQEARSCQDCYDVKDIPTA